MAGRRSRASFVSAKARASVVLPTWRGPRRATAGNSPNRCPKRAPSNRGIVSLIILAIMERESGFARKISPVAESNPSRRPAICLADAPQRIGVCLSVHSSQARPYEPCPTVQHRIPDHDAIVGGVLRVRLQPALCPTDDQFYEFCRLNRELRIERGSGGEGDDHAAGRMGECPEERTNHVSARGLGDAGWYGRSGGFLGRLRASERGGSFAGRFLGKQCSPGIRHRRAAVAVSSPVSRFRDRAAFPRRTACLRCRTRWRSTWPTAPRSGG